MKQLVTISILCLLVSIALPVVAQSPGMGQGMGAGPGMGRGMGRNMPAFSDFDLDKNGYLVEDEFIEARGDRVSARAKEGRMMRGLSSMMQFSELDQNADGKVTPDEFAAGLAAHRQKKFSK